MMLTDAIYTIAMLDTQFNLACTWEKVQTKMNHGVFACEYPTLDWCKVNLKFGNVICTSKVACNKNSRGSINIFHPYRTHFFGGNMQSTLSTSFNGHYSSQNSIKVVSSSLTKVECNHLFWHVLTFNNPPLYHLEGDEVSFAPFSFTLINLSVII